MVGNSPKTGGAECGDSDDHSLNVVCDYLATQRRRYDLACLADNTQSIALTELAENVDVHENEKALTEFPEAGQNSRRPIYHTPKMADVGVGEYDQARDLVRISDTADRAESVLSTVPDGGVRGL